MNVPVTTLAQICKHWYKRPAGLSEVLRVAIPLMISTGTFSIVLFADRTLLLWYDGTGMGASLAAGNLFWAIICLPVGIASMTGAFVAQYIGVKEYAHVGRVIWQAIWFAIAITPIFFLVWLAAPHIFQLTGQSSELIDLQSIYLRMLLLGAPGAVIETAISGFFSGTARTFTVMWVSIASAVVNIVLDLVFIYGYGPFPELGIAGAGLASSVSFWFKAFCFAWLIGRRHDIPRYQFREGLLVDLVLIKRLLFFGFPIGLQFVAESAGFTFIVLQIGRLGDIPLRATTMAMNFNMVAYVPLIGVSIAVSVLVGRHLMESGPKLASRAALTALGIALVYGAIWAFLYLCAPRWLLSLYQFGEQQPGTGEASQAAESLLAFVAMYVVVDGVQLVLSGALRGAGDTWYVLFAMLGTSIVALGGGLWFEPDTSPLDWWWRVITVWAWLLAIAMVLRFWQGQWTSMTLVDANQVSR